MFSGIVEGLKPVVSVVHHEESRTVRVDLEDLAATVRTGDSIAIDGCCLTVEGLAGTVAAFRVISETLALTTAADLGEGSRVNVERSLRVGDVLGGHFVTGHVDGVATIVEKREEPGQTWLVAELPGPLAPLVLHKGSIALDGVSLTVALADGPRVAVALVPHTLRSTTLGTKRAGDKLNVETDMIGKWVRQLLPGRAS
jgi:riboflavin synthase